MTVDISLTGVPSDSSIAQQVILGFCDLNGSSLRAVAALCAATGWSKTQHAMDIKGIDGLVPAFADDTGASPSSTATLINIHPDGGGEPRISIIALCAAVPEAKQAHVVAALMQLLAARRQARQGPGPSSQSCLFVLASTLIQLSKHQGVHVMCTSGAHQQPLPGLLASSCPPLPPASLIQDNMLALLKHVTEATGTPACFLLAPGYRPPVGSLAEPESREAAEQLLSVLLGALSSDAAAAAGLRGVVAAEATAMQRLVLTHPWFSEGRGSSKSDIMYC